MALLADQKRKAKFGLDPRNTNWSNDDSKIGQRMLEKMGWEKGKGLGAKEDGIKDHIKATYKSDTRGLGCTPKDADAWIAHQDDFNELLMQLNSKPLTMESPAEKQEERAPDGHKRYYGRFARGRVPTLRSTEDLNCIFGKRKTTSQALASESVTSSGSDSDEKKHGITTIKSSSSVQEYFSQKMAALKAKKEKSQTTDSPSEIKLKETDNENRVPAVYGAVQFMYDHESATVQSDKVEDKTMSCSSKERVEQETQPKKEKKTKKKKDKKGDCDEISENANVPNPCHLSHYLDKANVEIGDIDTKATSRKKKKKHQVDATDLVETNVKRDTEECIELVSLKRKVEPMDDAATEGKCKRRKLDQNHGKDMANAETTEMISKKESKGDATNIEADIDDASPTKKDKKSRKRKTVVLIEEKTNVEITETCTDESNKIKKKYKPKEIILSASVDLVHNSSDGTREKKSKKKSKNKETVLSESVETVENLPDSTCEKQSKKKSKNKKTVPSKSVETVENSPDNTHEKESKKKSKNKETVSIKSVETVENSPDSTNEEKSKKKSKNKETVPIKSVVTVENSPDNTHEEESKKKSKNKETVLNKSVETVENSPDNTHEEESKKKSKNKETVLSKSVETVKNLPDSTHDKQSKKKSKNIETVLIKSVETVENSPDSTNEEQSKKKSKNKETILSKSVETVKNSPDNTNEEQSKKKSKNKETVLSKSVETVKNSPDRTHEKQSKKKSKNKETVLIKSVETVENRLGSAGETKTSKKMSKDFARREYTDNRPDPKNMFNGANLAEIPGYAMTVPLRKHRFV